MTDLREALAAAVVGTFTTTMGSRGPSITRDQMAHVERLMDALLPLIDQHTQRAVEAERNSVRWLITALRSTAPATWSGWGIVADIENRARAEGKG